VSVLIIDETQDVAEPSMSRLVAAAYLALFLLFVILGGLSATISISGAVVTSGRLVVSSYPKPVEHLKGGIVAKLFVANGDSVKAGQVLIRLDDTQTKANLAIVEKRLKELNARAARLLAGESGADAVTFTPELIRQAADNPQIASLLRGETQLFAARKLAEQRRKDQLDQRVLQYGQQIDGLEAQIDGNRKQLALVQKEADGVGTLVAYDPQNQGEFVLAQRGADPDAERGVGIVSCGVRGDVVGCFLSR